MGAVLIHLQHFRPIIFIFHLNLRAFRAPMRQCAFRNRCELMKIFHLFFTFLRKTLPIPHPRNHA